MMIESILISQKAKKKKLNWDFIKNIKNKYY